MQIQALLDLEVEGRLFVDWLIGWVKKVAIGLGGWEGYGVDEIIEMDVLNTTNVVFPKPFGEFS